MDFSNIDSFKFTFFEEQLSFVGNDADCIPKQLVTSYGPLAKRLDLSFNCIRSLDNLDGFQNVEELIMDNNLLTENVTFPELPHLHTLMLNKNDIKDLDVLLDELQLKTRSLTYLSLLGNTACPNQLSSSDKDDDDYNRYRLYVLYRFPSLKFLDASPVTDQERKLAQKQGAFLKVVKPDASLWNSDATEASASSAPYSPLPQDTREEPDHKATYGRCLYVYHGRHSEGNRFIRNNDL